jgi:hypothetical protein
VDADRFDALSRAIDRVTRRVSLALGVIVASGSLLVAESEANGRRDRKFRRRTKRRHKRLRRKLRNSQQAPGTGTCVGSNGCDGTQCPNSSPGCFCRVEAGTGAYICAGAAYDVLNCEQCGPTETCVNLSACGGAGAVGCAVKCS